MSKNWEFTKTDTKMVKGLAIILMLMHHLWYFPDRIAGGELKYLITMFDSSSISVLGLFGKICVAIFFFVGGYGIYKSSLKKNFNILNNIKKLYINYWKVFLLFIPIAFLFFSNQFPYCTNINIYSKYAVFGWKDIFNNFLGFSSTLNSEWWFLYSYLIAIITFPLIKKIFSKHSTSFNLILIIIFTVLMANVFPAIGDLKELGVLNNNFFYSHFLRQTSPHISCFWLGILFAKDDLLFKCHRCITDVIKLNIVVDIIGIFIIVYLRTMYVGALLDILYVPLLIILFLDFIKRFKFLPRIFEMFGNNSTNMWLMHTFYCYYFSVFAKIVTSTEWAVPSLIILVILSLTSSIIVNHFWKLIGIIWIKGKKTLKRFN